MKLGEIIEFLTEEKSDGSRLFTQESLGQKIGTNQSTISQMKSGGRWEEHWTLCLRLVPICLEYDLIGERELLYGAHDPKRNSGSDKAHKKAEVEAYQGGKIHVKNNRS